MRTSILLLLLATLCSCAGGPYRFYEGPQKPLDDVAIIKTDYGFMGGAKLGSKTEFARLMSIDGVPGKSKKMGYHSRWDNSLNVALLPGKHTLSITYYLGEPGMGTLTTTKSVKPYELTMTFQKGHTYILSFKNLGITWTPIIVDTTLNKQVYPTKK